MHIALMGAFALDRCRKLLNIRSRSDTGALISKIIKGAFSAEFFEQYTRPSIAIGDFVSVFGDLCEVVGSAKSKFGYKSFKVRYLSPPPIAEQKEDWFPAINVKKQIDVKDLRDGVLELLSLPGVKLRNQRFVRKVLRENALRLWEELRAARRNS